MRNFPAFRSNLTAIMACMATNLSGSAGAIVWSLLDYFRIGNFSAFGFCLGAMCGLVTIVPASGYVGLSSSVAIGCIGSACCYFVSLFKDRFFFDDVMDVFIVNGVGGILGNVLAVSESMDESKIETKQTISLSKKLDFFVMIKGSFYPKVLWWRRSWEWGMAGWELDASPITTS